jgi:hypothetical protein
MPSAAQNDLAKSIGDLEDLELFVKDTMVLLSNIGMEKGKQVFPWI